MLPEVERISCPRYYSVWTVELLNTFDIFRPHKAFRATLRYVLQLGASNMDSFTICRNLGRNNYIGQMVKRSGSFQIESVVLVLSCAPGSIEELITKLLLKTCGFVVEDAWFKWLKFGRWASLWGLWAQPGFHVYECLLSIFDHKSVGFSLMKTCYQCWLNPHLKNCLASPWALWIQGGTDHPRLGLSTSASTREEDTCSSNAQWQSGRRILSIGWLDLLQSASYFCCVCVFFVFVMSKEIHQITVVACCSHEPPNRQIITNRCIYI